MKHFPFQPIWLGLQITQLEDQNLKSIVLREGVEHCCTPKTNDYQVVTFVI
jgi:hypothetical protein